MDHMEIRVRGTEFVSKACIGGHDLVGRSRQTDDFF